MKIVNIGNEHSSGLWEIQTVLLDFFKCVALSLKKKKKENLPAALQLYKVVLNI